jgi:hypothetical protein
MFAMITRVWQRFSLVVSNSDSRNLLLTRDLVAQNSAMRLRANRDLSAKFGGQDLSDVCEHSIANGFEIAAVDERTGTRLYMSPGQVSDRWIKSGWH